MVVLETDFPLLAIHHTLEIAQIGYIANTEISLGPNNSVIKGLWCTVKSYTHF